MLYAIIILHQAIMSRLSGSGFGDKWGVAWLPELLFSFPFGAACGYAVCLAFGPWYALASFPIATGCTYAGMQAATWLFLRWQSHDNPNLKRGATIKPVVDSIAARFGYKLGDEGYAWVAAAVKGFIIGLPVGGLPLMILWPLAYEGGSHFKNKAIREILAGAGAGLSIVLFLYAVKLILL